MKRVQGLIILVASMLALQVSASTVTHSDETPDASSEHGLRGFHGDLFGTLGSATRNHESGESDHESGEGIHDNGRTLFSRNNRSRRDGRISRFSSLWGTSGLFQHADRREEHRSRHESERRGHGETGDVTGDEAITAVPPAVTAVSAVPVPAAVWLFASGIAGLFAFARRRQG